MIFTYSLFIGLCLVTSDMTSYSHSYHLIKLIHCSAPQRDVMSDKNGVLSGDSYYLFHALPVFFIEYCHKLRIQTNCSPMKVCQLFSVWKIFEKNSFIPSPL